MTENQPCQWLCENKTFSAEETKLLHKRIKQGYSVHLYVIDVVVCAVLEHVVH